VISPKPRSFPWSRGLDLDIWVLFGWIDDEGEPLPATVGWKTEDFPTPNRKDHEKPLIPLMLILTVLHLLNVL
jgi:hypothetical protein